MAAAPEVAAIEKQLEETAGVTELLSKPERETAEPVAATTEEGSEE
jgi:copper chaperone CopZ